MRLIVMLLLSTGLAACATYDSFDNNYNYDFRNTTDVVLSTPNISAPHNPPLFIGVGYLEVYDTETFCEKVPGLLGERVNKGEPIGKMFAHASQRRTKGKIPVGQAVFRAGFNSQSFGNSECDRYFSFDAKAYRTYEVEVKESQPLVTHCYISVKELDLTGASTELTSLNSSKSRFFLDDDFSPVCGESSDDEQNNE